MDIKLADILGKNDKKYIRILRLLHLIEGVNTSINNSKKMNSSFMEKQYQLLKKEYTKELLEQLADYRLSITFTPAA